MKIYIRRRIQVSLLVFTSLIFPNQSRAQARPYTLTDVLQLVQAGLPSSSVLARVKKSCIDFKVTSDVESVLRGADADAQLIAGLRTTCVRSASPTPIPQKPVIRKKTVVESTITPDDTLPLIYDRNYAVVRDIPLVSDSICQKSFELGAYTISKRIGHTCEMTELTNVGDARIELHLSMVSGTPHFEAGLKFGVSADGNTFYTLTIDEAGSFAFQRLAGDRWVTLIPWTPSRLVRIGSGVTNVLAVRVEGRGVTLYVNGGKVGFYNADEPVTGYAGVGIFGSAGDATVIFRRLRALGERLPNPALPAVTPPVSVADGYGPFRLGMSLAEVVRLVYPDGSRDAWNWSSLQVAGEYPNKDMRYFWVSLRDLPSLPDEDLFAPCIGSFGNAVFLFTRQELVRISIRFDSSGCPTPQAMLSQFAARHRYPAIDAGGIPYYQWFSPTTHVVVAKLPPSEFVIEFIKEGSPRYTGEPWCAYAGGVCSPVSPGSSASPGISNRSGGSGQRTAALKAELRNLATAEEIFFADSLRYTTALSQLSFTPEPGTTVRITSASATGWGAVALYENDPSKGCAIRTSTGSEKPDAATPKGIRPTIDDAPVCDDGI